MVRPRRVPTSITSAAQLIGALKALGFADVERFETPQPLQSWRGKPLDVAAEIIVRRKSIGVTADDLGFVRGADGKYEALVSEILLSRFDRRWFSKLHESSETVAPAATPLLTPAPPAVPAKAAPEVEVEAAPKVDAEVEADFEVDALTQPEPPSQIELASTRVTALPEPVRETRDAVRRALEELSATLEAPSSVPSPTADLDLERELGAVLAAARSAGGGGKGCLPFVIGWFALCAVSLGSGNVKLFLFGSIATFVLFVRFGNRRVHRMADAALAELRARVRDPELRKVALKALVAGRSKQDPQLRQIIDVLVERWKS